MSDRGDHPLRGVRLGKMERWLLLHAPGPDALFGLVLDEPDAAVRDQLRRAACKLERVRLLEHERMQVYVRARDPRRERLVLHNGRLWLRTDSTRAHAVRRNVVWQSPFGFELVLRYRPQLATGTAIRWDRRTVMRAFERASVRSRDHRRVEIAAREEAERDEVILSDPVLVEPAVPQEVRSSGDLERWALAVAAAQERIPAGEPPAIWDLARELWASQDALSLSAPCPAVTAPRLSAAEQFRRRPRSQLEPPRRARISAASPISSADVPGVDLRTLGNLGFPVDEGDPPGADAGL